MFGGSVDGGNDHSDAEDELNTLVSQPRQVDLGICCPPHPNYSFPGFPFQSEEMFSLSLSSLTKFTLSKSR